MNAAKYLFKVLNLAFQNLILGPDEPIFCKILRVKSDHTVTKLSFNFCNFEKIEKYVFKKLNLSNIQELMFKEASFQDIEAGAFSFLSSNVSVVIDEVLKPFKLNQSPFSSGSQ